MKLLSPLTAIGTQETHPNNSHGAELATVATASGSSDLPQLDGDRVAARRWKLNLSQAQLGQRLGCNASRVCHLESGQSQRVTPQTLANLAGALDCTPADLLRR